MTAIADTYRDRIRKLLEDEPWLRNPRAVAKAERECRPKRVPTTESEWHEQKALCEWMRLDARMSYFAVPNGAYYGNRDSIRGAQLKMIGVKVGVPDLIVVDRAPCDGKPVAIEMKRKVGGRQSDDQKYWQHVMADKGWHYVLACGRDDGVRQLKELGYGGATR